jgi:two-component system, OmpR family, KDP operon response regulator KdpE
VWITGFGKLEINSLARSVKLRGAPLALTRKEFDLLAVLANANGGAVTHQSEVWGGKADTARQNLRRVVGSLRRKIGREPQQPTWLISLRGSGYRLDVQEEPGEAL